MQQHIRSALIALPLVALAVVYWKADQRISDIERIVATLERSMTHVLTATWTEADGTTHTVNTTQLPDESESTFTARHIARVQALKQAFPPG